jgi:hypothetical protein
VVALLAGAAFVGAVLCSSRWDSPQTPLARCGLPDDYDIMQIPPDRCLWSDREFGKTFTAAYEATNVASGLCHATSFDVVGDIDGERVYHDGETLTVTLDYDAPGCVEASLTFGGFHLNGSPWAMHYCGNDGCAGVGFNSNIFAERARLTADRGRITFVAQPGTFPPVDLASPPNLEGFMLCSLVVGFNDGRVDGSRTSEQFDIDSAACRIRG